MSMRSEGVILGAGSNPLAVPHRCRFWTITRPDVFPPLSLPVLARKLIYALSQLAAWRGIRDWHRRVISFLARISRLADRQRRALPLFESDESSFGFEIPPRFTLAGETILI